MKDKKDLLGGVIIVSLLLLVLVTYMTFYNYNKQEEKNAVSHRGRAMEILRKALTEMQIGQ